MMLEIITHPQNKQVKFGSSITLSCTSSLSSSVTFSWTHNGTIIRNTLLGNGDTSRLTTNVTGFGKTDHIVTIDISRNTDLKY